MSSRRITRGPFSWPPERAGDHTYRALFRASCRRNFKCAEPGPHCEAISHSAIGTARLQIAPKVVNNHTSGTTGGIAAAYDGHSYSTEKYRAYESLASMVVRIVSGQGGNAIRLRG
jgi:hypothetical protein